MPRLCTVTAARTSVILELKDTQEGLLWNLGAPESRKNALRQWARRKPACWTAVPLALPALAQAERYQKRPPGGFDCRMSRVSLDKLEEELREVTIPLSQAKNGPAKWGICSLAVAQPGPLV